MTNLNLQVCTKLVMDTSDPDISFDADGVSNHWHEYQAFAATLPTSEQRDAELQSTLSAIRAAGKGKAYDVVLGLSGGVDSSYMMYLAHKYNLRPLVVHFDNGWNSELAVHNIEKLVEKFDYHLETFVMNWEEFRDVQRAYFKASVVDLEVPTDHMIFGALHKIAAKRGIKYILSGTNHATEWLMPKSWNYTKTDVRNLKNIHAKFGELPLKSLPALGIWMEGYYRIIKGIKSVPILDLIDYSKSKAKSFLIEEAGWRDYGGKHYESVFTRFYQGYVLPNKFGIDKRKAHLSNLILTGEITRDEALRELQQPTYDEDLKVQDKVYVAKKLGFSDEEFEAILCQPNIPHVAYGTDAADRKTYFRVVGALGGVRRLFRKNAAAQAE